MFKQLLETLSGQLQHAVTAENMMTREVVTIKDSWSLKDASICFEEMDLSGTPVLNERNELCGMLTLRDIMKGRKKEQMNAPVKAYMRTKLVTCETGANMREIENLMFINSIGHLPVLDQGKLVGIITRSDLLKFLQGI